LPSCILLTGDNILKDRAKFGQAIENAFLKHIYGLYYSQIPNFYYWRSPTDEKEVDIICQYGSQSLAFEIKYSSNKIALSDIKGMINLLKKEQVSKAYLITGNEQDIGYMETTNTQPKIFRLPAHIACFVSGKQQL